MTRLLGVLAVLPLWIASSRSVAASPSDPVPAPAPDAESSSPASGAGATFSSGSAGSAGSSGSARESGWCGIRILRAPDDLRAAVEAALKSDPVACTGDLDVWLIPSQGQVYVQARDHLGRVRERVVPDAAIAATLLASWVEVDAAEPVWQQPPPARVTAAPASVYTTREPILDEREPILDERAPARLAAPGMTDAVTARAAAPRDDDEHRRWGLGFFAMATGSDMSGGGVHGDVDLVERGAWSLLAAANAGSLAGYAPMSGWEERRGTLDLLVTLRRRLFRGGSVEIVPSLSAGGGVAYHELGGLFDDRTIGPRAELAVALSIRAGRHGSVDVGVANGVAGYFFGRNEMPIYLDSTLTGFVALRFDP